MSETDRRPPTPHDFGLLKTLRYEDAEDGVPPIPIASLDSPRPPPRSPKRPVTSPTARASVLSREAKRDSGIAPSVSTTGRASYTGSQLSSATGAAKEPNLPTIVVQDEDSPESVERSRSPFFRKRSKESEQAPRGQPPAVAAQGIQRISSFKGIQADIPTGTFDDIDLEDLASDKVGFSHRGSLMFGGKKMNDMIASQGDSARSSDGIVQPMGIAQDEATVLAGAESVEPPRESAQEHDVAKHGLVTGRRKPSVHMIQAALDGGRVLSAEEISFSMKVRCMYEHGDERAPEWFKITQNGTNGQQTTELNPKNDKTTSEVNIDGLLVSKTRQTGNERASLKPPADDVRASYLSKDSRELAGGVEDWEDVGGQDVDRYGFINSRRIASRSSTASGQGEGLQRVATSLRFESDQPRRIRKLNRNASSAYSARSMPPRPSRDGTAKQAPASMHSFQSNTSSKSRPPALFSRDRRTLAEAADMLTLPPGLADIAEQEDAGKTASMLKRREWGREEKWQKMARPVRERSNSKGGGMQFDFDTSDPKLVNRTWKGIPDRWRATAWHCFLSTSARRRGKHTSDEELTAQFHKLQEESCADDVQIDVDVPRTISMHIMFRRRYRGGQRLLFRVLHAISLHCPDTGYVQGMASLAATLLCYYDEEKAFVMLVRLWQLRGLEQLYQTGFDGLMNALNDFEKNWLGGGDVAQKLEELGITSTAYGTRWYLTLFNMSVPFPAQLRVWDVFMLLGDATTAVEGKDFGGADLDVLHATSAAMIDATREIILDSDFENAMKVLTSFVPIKDEDLLMRVARAEWKMRKRRAGVKV